MKVLFLTHHFFPTIGGIESYSLGLAKELQRNKIEVKVVCFDSDPITKQKLATEETIQGIAIKRIPFIDFGFYKIGFGLLKEIKQADLVHVQNIGFLSDFALLAKALHKKPVVVSTHGGVSHTKKRALIKSFYSSWLDFLLKHANFVIADSPQDFKEFEKKTKRIKLIENGVDLERFFAVKRNAIPNSFVFVGRISRNKRIDLLIDAIAAISNKKPDVRLKIIGKDFDGIQSGLIEKAKTLRLEKNVFFENNADDAQLLKSLGESEFFVSASEFEGFGISVIEAMAAGCIPCLNNIDAFRAFVVDKENGFLADFANAEKAAEKIINLLELTSSEKKKISVAARESVEKYSWKNVVSDIIGVYESVLE
jgi:alpha-1,3-mannosyltransferase